MQLSIDGKSQVTIATRPQNRSLLGVRYGGRDQMPHHSRDAASSPAAAAMQHHGTILNVVAAMQRMYAAGQTGNDARTVIVPERSTVPRQPCRDQIHGLRPSAW